MISTTYTDLLRRQQWDFRKDSHYSHWKLRCFLKASCLWDFLLSTFSLNLIEFGCLTYLQRTTWPRLKNVQTAKCHLQHRSKLSLELHGRPEIYAENWIKHVATSGEQTYACAKGFQKALLEELVVHICCQRRNCFWQK